MGIQHLNWEGPLPLEQVTALLRQSFFGTIAGERATRETLCAEALRIALWEQSISELPRTMGEAAISTHNILSRARMLLQPFWSSFTSDASAESERDNEENSRTQIAG